jgi:hypothetical protein
LLSVGQFSTAGTTKKLLGDKFESFVKGDVF